MEKKLYVPIETKYESWYMDVSDLSLSELIELKNELRGSFDSISVIDGIIKEEYISSLWTDKLAYRDRKEYKRQRINKKIKIRRNRK